MLIHPLSEALIRTNTSLFRGGYYSHGKQFIKNLPVPLATEAQRAEIEEQVTALIAVLDELAAARTPRDRRLREREAVELRSQIESRVSAVFGLSATDIDTVCAVPVPD